MNDFLVINGKEYPVQNLTFDWYGLVNYTLDGSKLTVPQVVFTLIGNNVNTGFPEIKKKLKYVAHINSISFYARHFGTVDNFYYLKAQDCIVGEGRANFRINFRTSNIQISMQSDWML